MENGWVFVGADESIRILTGSSEMGQGSYSGLAQTAAEELKVAWTSVSAGPAPAGQSWGTGGSSNIRRHFTQARTTAAAAREMLIAAAAQTWNVSPNVNSTLLLTQAGQLLAAGPAVAAEQQGDAIAALQSAANVIDATYSLPYLAHACMEVRNCTVRLTAKTCEIWAPTQVPNGVLKTAMALTGLPASQITVHPMLMGGGLGRKSERDYVNQVIAVAQAIGKPVKLTWTRE